MQPFWTSFTLGTAEASLPAADFWPEVSTKPLSWTTPWCVSTLIWNDFTASSPRRALFTLVVTTVSSTYCPVVSGVDFGAQPLVRPPSARAPINARDDADVANWRDVFMEWVGFMSRALS